MKITKQRRSKAPKSYARESAFEKLLADTIAADADRLEREAFARFMRARLTSKEVKLACARMRAAGYIKAQHKTMRRLPRAGHTTTRSLRRREATHDTEEIDE